MRSLRVAPVVLAAGLLLAACGGSSSEGGSSSAAAPSSSAAASSSSAAVTVSPSASSDEIFASLCDKATPEQTSAIEAVMKPDYTVSQLSDVRTDDAGTHAVLGFVQGPGLAVLAIWTGTGITLEGLSSADEFSAQSSSAPAATPDADTQKLIDATVQCYTTLFAPQDTGKKDKKKS